MKFSIAAKAVTITVVAALALFVAPFASAESKSCSLATLKGTFSDRDTGYIAGLGQFAGVNLYTFDGHGKITGIGMTSLNGLVISGASSGTYTVNPDCTGTFEGQDSQGQTHGAYFVIDDGGNELQILVTDPGTVITCIARRQFPVSDSEQ